MDILKEEVVDIGIRVTLKPMKRRSNSFMRNANKNDSKIPFFTIRPTKIQKSGNILAGKV